MVPWNRALKTILWKNGLLSNQQKRIIFMEALVPILFFVLLACVNRLDVKTKEKAIKPTINDITSLRSYLPAHTKWQLWHAPFDEIHEKIINYVRDTLNLDDDYILSHASIEELENEFKNYKGEDDIVIVTFQNNISQKLSYNISIHSDYLVWDTKKLYRDHFPRNNAYNPYLHEGFLALQIAIDTAYINILSHKTVEVTLQEMALSHVVDDGSEPVFFMDIVPLSIIFCFGTLHFFSMLKGMRFDEYSGLNDLLKVSGVKLWVILFGWFIQRFAIVIIPCLVTAASITLVYSSIHWSIFFGSFFLLVAYNMTTIYTQLFLACLSRRSSTVYLLGFIIWLSTCFLSGIECPFVIKIFLACFFPNTAVAWGYNVIVTSTNQDSHIVELTYIFSTFVANLLLSHLACIVIDSFHKRDLQSCELLMDALRSRSKIDKEAGSGDAEQSYHPKAGIRIKNLKKKYGVFVALDINYLELFQGEVTVVLGINGAGKSTLTSILAGMIKSYTGSVEMNLADDTSIGYCPAENVTIWGLTVKENVQFFAKLRNCNDDSDTILNDMKIHSVESKLPKDISSGMRRMLCLLMTLVGQPKILILDEPTRGLSMESVYAMRTKLDKSAGSTTTTVVVTHSRREAEILNDRLVVLNEGKIIAHGTNDQLGKKLGHVITLTANTFEDVKRVQRKMEENQNDFGSVSILRTTGTKLILQFNVATDCGAIIKKLEAVKDDWHVKKIEYNVFGLTNFYMKQIKHLQTKDKVEDRDEELKNSDGKVEQLWSDFKERNYGYKISLFIKRWFFLRRQLIWFFPGVVTLGVFVLLIQSMIKVDITRYEYNESPLHLVLSTYNGTEVYEGPRVLNISGLVNDNNCTLSKELHLSGATNERSLVGLEFPPSQDEAKLLAKISFSPTAIHSAPISINLAMNAILQSLLGSDYSITTLNKPFNKEKIDFLKSAAKYQNLSTLCSVWISTGLLFVLGNYLVFPFIERTKDLTKYQITDKTRLIVYWTLNLLVDLSLNFIGMWLIYLLLVGLFSEGDVIAIICLICTTIQIPVCYLFSSTSNLKIRAFSKFYLFSLTTGTSIMIIASKLGIHTFAHFVGILFPHFMGGHMLSNFFKKSIENYNWNNLNPREKRYLCMSTPDPCCDAKSLQCAQHQSYYNNEKYGIANLLYYSLVSFILWHCILVVSSIYSKTNYGKRKKIESNSREMELLNMYWDFSENSNTRTRSTLNASLPIGDCKNPVIFESNMIYGFRGGNDSGKTKYLATLAKAAYIKKYDGEVYIKDFLHDNKIPIGHKEYNSKIGYYSYTSDLNHYLTGLEFLILHGISRGYSISKSRRTAKILLCIFGLEKVGDSIIVRNLSSGNKKRLQICIALMGFSDFVIIDDFSKFLDATQYETFAYFLQSFKKVTQKTIILGLLSGESYGSLCDKIIDLKGGKAAGNENEPAHTITFRIREDGGSNSPKGTIQNEFKSKVNDLTSRYCEIVVVGEKSISDLFERAEKLRTKDVVVQFSIRKGNLSPSANN